MSANQPGPQYPYQPQYGYTPGPNSPGPTGQPNPQQPYQQPYQQPQQYPQPYPPQQPGQQYPQQYGYGPYQGSYQQNPLDVVQQDLYQQQRQRGRLGLIGLLVVAACTVIGSLIAVPIGQIIVQVVELAGAIDEQSLAAAMTPSARASLNSWSTALSVVSTAGFVGWILSIVGAVRKSSRAAGVFGILLGIVAPLIIGGVVVAVMFPALAPYVR